MSHVHQRLKCKLCNSDRFLTVKYLYTFIFQVFCVVLTFDVIGQIYHPDSHCNRTKMLRKLTEFRLVSRLPFSAKFPRLRYKSNTRHCSMSTQANVTENFKILPVSSIIVCINELRKGYISGGCAPSACSLTRQTQSAREVVFKSISHTCSLTKVPVPVEL